MQSYTGGLEMITQKVSQTYKNMDVEMCPQKVLNIEDILFHMSKL